MPQKAVEELARLYKEFGSCSKVAAITGRTRQSVHTVLQKRGLTNPNDKHGARRKAGAIYKGERFTPDRDGYLRSTRYASRLKGGHRLLHKVVWEEHFGPVPQGNIVVFKDGNRQNCVPDNLACMSRSEWRRQHWSGNGWTKYREKHGALLTAWQDALATGNREEISRARRALDALTRPVFRDGKKLGQKLKKLWASYTPEQRQARIDKTVAGRWGDRSVA